MCLKRQEDLFQALKEIHPEIRKKDVTRGPSFTSSTLSSARIPSRRASAAAPPTVTRHAAQSVFGP